jgi:hypothetical protein
MQVPIATIEIDSAKRHETMVASKAKTIEQLIKLGIPDTPENRFDIDSLLTIFKGNVELHQMAKDYDLMQYSFNSFGK